MSSIKVVLLFLFILLLFSGRQESFTLPGNALAAPQIFASPVHSGCYLVKRDRCKIHVEPFTINLAVGKKLVRFQLVANRIGGNNQVIYDFRPDASNPVPYGSATTFSPTLVKQDFAATCSASYTVTLRGEDTGDNGILYNLGTTHQFTCPKATFFDFIPSISR